tara:strand:- start:17 stop:319 length:303 start_codon:yes stop_codon:yes gene_type:complete
MKELTTEAEVVALIGYETVLKFHFISEGVFIFKTLIPTEDSVIYEIELFSGEDRHIEFFDYDSFSNFLLSYQIHSLTAVSIDGQIRTELYSRHYDKNYNK